MINTTFTPSQFESRSLEEAHTHCLTNQYAHDTEWSSLRASLCSFWRSQWMSSFTLDRIVAINNAISGIEFSKEDTQKELSLMVRHGVLRSRRVSGMNGSKRCWEVNY